MEAFALSTRLGDVHSVIEIFLAPRENMRLSPEEEAGSVPCSLTRLDGVHSALEIFPAPRESMRLSPERKGNVPIRVRVLGMFVVRVVG